MHTDPTVILPDMSSYSAYFPEYAEKRQKISRPKARIFFHFVQKQVQDVLFNLASALPTIELPVISLQKKNRLAR
jgi:hypothetical protein